jgi:hypothetical protein
LESDIPQRKLQTQISYHPVQFLTHTMGPNDTITSFGPCSVHSAPMGLSAGGGDDGGGMGNGGGRCR